MKTFFNVLGCIVVVTVAAIVGQNAGFFKIPGLDDASRYGNEVVVWAKGGFKGTPAAAGAPSGPVSTAVASEAKQVKAEFAQLVGESKQRAIAKYPDLSVANTEMNSRFVFRYNWMVKEGSALLQDAAWPEKLADDCAKAAKVTAKTLSNGPATPRKKMVASVAQ